MRVISWNMAHNRRAWEYLGELDPDVALLQEVNPSKAPGWVHEKWPDQVAWPPASWSWRSAILAKPGLDLTPFPGGPEGMEVGGWIATGFVTLPDGTNTLVGSVHAPPLRVSPEHLVGHDPASVKLSKSRVPRYYDVAYATYRNRTRGGPFIVGGDWNISRDLWRVLHPDTHDKEFFDRAARDGWTDCYRRDHKHEGQTWYRAGNLPYQFDHVFCDEKTAQSMRSCEIDPHPASCLRVSDHAPLKLEFHFQAAPSTDGDRHVS